MKAYLKPGDTFFTTGAFITWDGKRCVMTGADDNSYFEEDYLDFDEDGKPYVEVEPFENDNPKEVPTMGYYVSVTVDLKSRKPPAQIAAILQNAGFEVEIEDIYQEDCFSYANCSIWEFNLYPESVTRLIINLMNLEPEPAEGGPQLVFCDDLEQSIWGYRICGETAVPYVSVLQENPQARPLRKAELEAAPQQKAQGG